MIKDKEFTYNDYLAEAHEDQEKLEDAIEAGCCMHCGEETEGGHCGKYKCWIA